jgi:hypothetical protein
MRQTTAMSRLTPVTLLDHLLTLGGGEPARRGRYDESRALTVDDRGVPLVAGVRGETHEITEVGGERDDLPPQWEPDPNEPAPDPGVEIRTFIERESDELSDWARVIDATRTDTLIAQETPDRSDWG